MEISGPGQSRNLLTALVSQGHRQIHTRTIPLGELLINPDPGYLPEQAGLSQVKVNRA